MRVQGACFSHGARQFHPVGGHALGMLAGIRIAGLDGVRERPNGRPVGLLQLLRALALLLEHLAQVRGIAFELMLALRSLLLDPLQACSKRRNSLLTGTGAQFLTIGARQSSS